MQIVWAGMIFKCGIGIASGKKIIIICDMWCRGGLLLVSYETFLNFTVQFKSIDFLVVCIIISTIHLTKVLILTT